MTKGARMPAAEQKERPPCPGCGSTQVVPIVYGYPGWEMGVEADQGRVALGGCVVSGDDPQWHCKACGRDFGTPGAAGPRG